MRIIGLTGGIASGKTTVARMLEDLGATIVDADALVHAVQRPGESAFDEIVERFGTGVVGRDGSLDRTRLGEIVFSDEQARRDLERITHPRVRALIAERVSHAAASGATLAVVDVPLLFEVGSNSQFPSVLLVYAPESVQVNRLRQRTGMSAAEARRRIAAQMPIEQKRQRATWVIDNSDSLDATRAQVQDWWHEVMEA